MDSSSLPSTIELEEVSEIMADDFSSTSIEDIVHWSECPVCKSNECESDEWAHFKAVKEVHLAAHKLAEDKAANHLLQDYMHYYMLYYRMEYERLYAIIKKRWWEVFQLILIKKWRVRGVKLCCYHSEPIYDDPPIEFNEMC